jgi:hypothetical protein
MGEIRNHLNNKKSEVGTLLLTECATRAIKNEVRSFYLN